MLIKESTLRRIIREEARRSLREETAPPAIVPGGPQDQWKGVSLRISSLAATFSTEVPGGGGPKLLAAVKDLIAKGNQSAYAKFVNKPATVTNAPPTANGELGRLACVLAALADGKSYTDFLSAQTILMGKTTTQDILSAPLIKALGGDANTATGRMSDIQTLGTKARPDYVKPAQAPMAADPGAGTFLSSELAGNVPSNVKIGRLSYTLPANTIAQITPSLLPVAKGQKILAKGSKGADVAALQQLLNLIAQQNPNVLTQIKSDSDFGDATVAAVTAYQKAAGVVADGKVGQQTLAQIIGRNASMTGQAGDKGNTFRGLQTAAGTTPAGVAGVNPNRIIATKPTQSEGRRRR